MPDYTFEELDTLERKGVVPPGTAAAAATSAAPAVTPPAPKLVAPSYSGDDLGQLERKSDRWEAEPATGKESGYTAMLPAAGGRAIAGSVGGPIDLYNSFERRMREGIGDTHVPARPSAVRALEKGLGVNQYEPTDSLEKASYDAATAGASAVIPWGVGRFGMGAGALARASGFTGTGSQMLTKGSRLLTTGGPGTAFLTGAGGELGGEAAAYFAPEGQEDSYRLGGNIAGGALAAAPLSAAKAGINALGSSMDAKALTNRTLLERLGGRSAVPILEGTAGPPGFGPPPMTRTAEEVLSEASPSYATGIASFDKYLREKAAKAPLTGESPYSPEVLPGETPYDAAARQRNVARQQNVEIGTDAPGGIDPGIALASTHTGLQTPSATELTQQAAARTAQGALPARTAAEAQESMGAGLTRWHSDSLAQQTAQQAEVGRLLGELDSHPNKLMQDFKNKVETRDPVTREGTGGVDQRKYEAWMDKNKGDLTPVEYHQLATIGAAHEELGYLTKQTQELAKQFPTAPGGTNAGLAKQYFKSDADFGAAAAKKYKDLTGGGAAEMSDAFDYGIAQFKASPGALNADGSINHVKLGQFMDSHKGWLDTMPTHLTDKLNNYHAAQELFDRTSTIRTQALKDFEESSIAPYLGLRDSKEAMKDILTEGNPVSNIRGVMDKLRGNLPAQNGLRRNFMEHGAENHFMNKAPDGSYTTFNPDGFQTFFRQNEEVIKQLYGRPGYNVLKRVNDDIISQKNSAERLARVEAGAPPGGAEGKIGKLIESGTQLLGHKWLTLSSLPVSAAYMILTGGVSPAIVHSVQAGAAINNVIRGQQRRGVQSATDRMSELMNNPQALALVMKEAPTDPKSPFYRNLAASLASGASGIASERATHTDYADAPATVIPMVRSVPGERAR